MQLSGSLLKLNKTLTMQLPEEVVISIRRGNLRSLQNMLNKWTALASRKKAKQLFHDALEALKKAIDDIEFKQRAYRAYKQMWNEIDSRIHCARFRYFTNDPVSPEWHDDELRVWAMQTGQSDPPRYPDGRIQPIDPLARLQKSKTTMYNIRKKVMERLGEPLRWMCVDAPMWKLIIFQKTTPAAPKKRKKETDEEMFKRWRRENANML